MNSENNSSESTDSPETVTPAETASKEIEASDTAENLPIEPKAVEPKAAEPQSAQLEATSETPAIATPEAAKAAPLRARLNPKGADAMKAVGSEGLTATQSDDSATPAPATDQPVVSSEPSEEPATEETPASTETHTAVATSEEIEKAILEPPKKSAPVEIPKTEELDENIEAQLAAALGEESATASPDSESPATTAAPAAGVTVPTTDNVSEGDRLKGKVQSIHGDDVFVDVGARLSAVVSSRQFPAGVPEIGKDVTIKVSKVDEAEGLIYANLAGGRQKVAGNWDAVDVGQIVDCVVTKTVKGGLEVTVSSLRGFMPAGQVDIGFINDLEQYVEQKLTCQIIEVNPKKRNLVVSRRAYMQSQREEAQKDIWETLALGQQHSGTVKTLKNYGAFIDLGMIDGFLHVGEISWMRVHHPSDVLKEGQQVEVQIISLDPEKKRIGLGMRQLVENPWTSAENKYEKGSTVSGKVTRTTDFGAFVELEQGVEGLIHISELDHKRVHKVTDVLSEGQQVDTKVLEVDQKKHRISLSLKSLIAKPERVKKEESEEPVEPYVRKRKGPLKGGIGSSEGTGLFGSPGDFK